MCLELALAQYGIQFLMKNQYVPLSPPVFMRKEVMQEVRLSPRTAPSCLTAPTVGRTAEPV